MGILAIWMAKKTLEAFIPDPPVKPYKYPNTECHWCYSRDGIEYTGNCSCGEYRQYVCKECDCRFETKPDENARLKYYFIERGKPSMEFRYKRK